MAASDEMSLDQIEPIRTDLIVTLAQLYDHAFHGRRSNAPDSERPQRHATLIKNVQTFIENHLDEPLSLQDIARLARMSPNYLNRLFSTHTGEPIHKHLTRRRMEKAMRLRIDTNLLVKQIALMVGYDDPLYFSRAFFKYHGRWPSDIRR